jgi:hypothetical protein
MAVVGFNAGARSYRPDHLQSPDYLRNRFECKESVARIREFLRSILGGASTMFRGATRHRREMLAIARHLSDNRFA